MTARKTRRKIRRYLSGNRRPKRRSTKHGTIYKGGHENEDLPHYHLLIKIPRMGGYQTFELPAMFARSDLSRKVTAAMVHNLNIRVREVLSTKGIFRPFVLIWKGRRLGTDTIKLRQIVVDGEKIPYHKPNIDAPIYVMWTDGDEPLPPELDDYAYDSDQTEN